MEIVTFRACADQLSRTLNIEHIVESFFKPRIHISNLDTFYLAGSALCIDKETDCFYPGDPIRSWGMVSFGHHNRFAIFYLTNLTIFVHLSLVN